MPPPPDVLASDAPPTDPARQRFMAALRDAVARQRLGKLVLSKPQPGPGVAPDWQRTLVRLIELRGQPQLQFVHRHDTRDLTRNLPAEDGLAEVDRLLGAPFRHGHLQEGAQQWQLLLSRKGVGHLVHKVDRTAADDAAGAPAAPAPHNREKRRWVPQDRAWLAELGVTDAQHRVLPTMAAKWKQINKFVEVFAQALAKSPLKDARTLRVVDFGAGRGYLTFAVADWLATQGVQADVAGVELRAALVDQCNAIVQRHGPAGLHFDAGDLHDEKPRPMNVMIALHACDTATDLAMALGVRAGADILLCSPCCHKQVRPQLLAPGPLKPVLAHGIHADEQAEMLTDALRALLLEAAGYDTQVFEFVSLEHTAKNKMILAVRRAAPKAEAARAAVLAQVDELKRFFGIREQALEAQLRPLLQPA